MKNSPITLEQKRILITEYQQNGGNMTSAMRKAGIASRKTAYLWWRRFQEGGIEALHAHSHRPKSSHEMSEPIAAEVCSLYRLHPAWGRRRIAYALTAKYQYSVISPSGVERVLRRANLWGRTIPEVSPLPATRPILLFSKPFLDRERLLAKIQTGLDASMKSDAKRAVTVLADEVIKPLGQHQELFVQLLNDNHLGKWLLRSWVQLGHSYMNAGQWGLARMTLTRAMSWMDNHEPPQSERETIPATGMPSLDWNDIWLDGYQYMGIVWRDVDATCAEGYLEGAIQRLEWKGRRGRLPTDYNSHRANYERDLGKQKLRQWHSSRKRIDVQAIQQHLATSQDFLEQGSSLGMQAATAMAWAGYYHMLACEAKGQDLSAWKHHLSCMQQASQKALDLVRQETSPILNASFIIDAAILNQAHDSLLSKEQLLEAAQYCLKYDYGGQAEQLLKLPNIHELLPEDLFVELCDRFAVSHSKA